MSREYTKEEVREMVLWHMRNLARYWARQEGTPLDKCEGVVFSVLSMLDGSTGLPAFDLVARTHPDYKGFQIAEGENYIPDGLVINDDCQLHELFYSNQNAAKAPVFGCSDAARAMVGEAGKMPGTSGFTMACFKAEDVPVGTKLYAGPHPAAQERKPLTDAQILSMEIRGTKDEALRFARAVERAHGITGDTK